MTDIFHYDDLTWPDVAELSRDVPFVLPFGSFPDPERVAAQLGDPQRLGILPSIPYGWRGRGPSTNEKRINEYGAPSRRRRLQEQNGRLRPSRGVSIDSAPRTGFSASLALSPTSTPRGWMVSLFRQAQHKVSIRVRAAMGSARGWNHPCQSYKVQSSSDAGAAGLAIHVPKSG